MKSYFLFSLSFAIGIQAQSTATQQYNSVCPALHGQEHEISPGYTVKYMCNTRGSNGAVHSNIDSPGACAALCESSPDCAATTWAYASRKCQLHLQAEPSGTYTGRLHMQHVEEDPLGPDPEEEDPLALDDCAEQNEEIEALESELAECFGGNGVSGCQVPSYTDCSAGGHGQVFNIGNRPIKQFCAGTLAVTAVAPYKRVHGLTRHECALICALDAQCRGAYYPLGSTTQGQCQMTSIDMEPLLHHSNGAHLAYLST